MNHIIMIVRLWSSRIGSGLTPDEPVGLRHPVQNDLVSHCVRACALLAFFVSLVPSSVGAAERYAAMFTDGSRVEEAEVREWFEPTSPAQIANRQIFDPNNPARWIIDRQQLVAASAPMFVEFFCGDRLGGEVVGFQADSGNPYEQQPAHLIVKPLLEVQPPDDLQSCDVRVSLEWVRRIVWNRKAADDYRPGTVWLQNGGTLAYRSLRWASSGVTLLTADGVKELSFGDLAEIHLPKLDAWNCYYDQLAVISPKLKSRIIQLETNDGSVWTTSTERFQARHHGDRNRPDQWYQLLQPAWSLDPIWVRYRTIRLWRFLAPNNVPLSNMWPIEVRREAVFGTAWSWRTNQNVQNGPLQSATLDFGWGFGVQASCDLSFDYPEAARTFRTQFGLDRAAGSGGFARLSMAVGNGPPSGPGPQPNLQGSQTVGDTGWLQLPPGTAEQRRILLRADMAHSDRPPEADPFDIRDSVNWYEPEIQLDPAVVAAEVQPRSLGRLPGLSGWTMSPTDVRTLIVKNTLDVTVGRDPQYRLTTGTSDRFYVLSRKLKVGTQHRWLSIIASRFADATPTFVQVRVDDNSLGEFEVPLRDQMTDPDPILVSMDNFRGKTIQLDLVVFPNDEKSFVDWRGMALTTDRPGLRTIFEDDRGFASLLNHGAGIVELSDEKPYSGNVSLKLTPDAGENAQIPGLNATISDQPHLGQFRYVVFAWKKTGGTEVEIQFASDGRIVDEIGLGGRRFEGFRDKPARGHLHYEGSPTDRGLRHRYSYEAGTGRQNPGDPLRLNGSLPKDWQLLMRDLFGDFGYFNLTGLSLKCIDGESAQFDHIYLARTPQDMESVRTYLVNPIPPPPALDPSVLDFATARSDYGRLMAPFAPQFSTLDLGHGLYRVREHAGQTDALRTHPNSQDKPAILRTGVTLPKDRPSMLDMHISHWPNCDWVLIVRVNGEVIHQELIDTKLTLPQKGWACVQVDLTRFMGQKVYVEVLNQSNNWNSEYSFWKRLAIVDK